MDHLDKIILKELLKDGRKSFTDIAKENNVSQDTVWKRYKKMKKEGIIVGSTIQINNRLFGFLGIASLELGVKSQDIENVFNRLTKIPNVLTARTFGPYAFASVTNLRNLDELEQIKQR